MCNACLCRLATFAWIAFKTLYDKAFRVVSRHGLVKLYTLAKHLSSTYTNVCLRQLAPPSDCLHLRTERDSRFHVYGNDAGNALLLHGHADQLIGHFHGDLVMRNEQELGIGGHAFDHIAE